LGREMIFKRMGLLGRRAATCKVSRVAARPEFSFGHQVSSGLPAYGMGARCWQRATGERQECFEIKKSWPDTFTVHRGRERNGIFLSSRPDLLFSLGVAEPNKTWKHLRVTRLEKNLPIKRNFADALFDWAGKFARAGLMAHDPTGWTGNLSYRHALGFVITGRQANSKKLTDHDLIFVEKWDFETGRLTVRGEGDPPDTSFLHALIYQNRSGAIFAFHVCHPEMEKAALRLGLPTINDDVFADDCTLMRQFESKLGMGNLIVVRGLGIFSFGCTAEDAGEPLIAIDRKSHGS